VFFPHRHARLRRRLFGILDQGPGLDCLGGAADWALIGLMIVTFTCYGLGIGAAALGISVFRSVLERLGRHVAKSLEQGGPRHRIVDANECYRAGMAQCLPITFGALDRGSRTGAFERFTCDQAFIGQVEMALPKSERCHP
jgi:hypothetical protein